MIVFEIEEEEKEEEEEEDHSIDVEGSQKESALYMVKFALIICGNDLWKIQNIESKTTTLTHKTRSSSSKCQSMCVHCANKFAVVCFLFVVKS